mmetsp:Transcript_36340/g.53119  ORF Transcript_36340/g.53119 Transcript_36340/m.53119 type:complete len:177 (-) Transcript_36340:109-639(-)
MLHPYKRNNNKLRLFHFLTILSLCIITSQYNAFAKVTKGDNDDDKKNNKKGKQRKTKGKGYDLPPESALRVGVKYRPDECLRKSKSGDVLKVHYVGTLYKNGKQFDSSRKREEPFQFTLGQNQVIKGWEHGLQNMCINETRKLVIPSEMAYGTVGTPLDVGANATLAYVVELLDIL